MQRIRLLTWICCFICAPALLAGCSIVEPDREELLTLYVAPYTATCVGVDVQRCLLVKQAPEAEWTFFYDGIEGFTYEPGFAYTLRVARRHVPNPPADGSSVAYRLITVLAKVPESNAG